MSKKTNNIGTCFFCGGDLILDSDEIACDVATDYEEDDMATVSAFHCATCGRDYLIYEPNKETKEKYYANYWTTN